MIIVAFFRDVLDGFVYWIYVLVCIFLQFSLYGIIADRKRRLIQDELLKKKERDIESGKEAAKAASHKRHAAKIRALSRMVQKVKPRKQIQRKLQPLRHNQHAA